MVKLYGLNNSRSNRILWALEEIAEPYEYHNINFAKGEHRSPQFLAKNPGGKVPILEDEGFFLTESAAIVTYLGDKYPEKNLVPKPATRERAKYDEWLAFVISELEQPLWTMGKHKFVFPAEKRVPEIKEVALWEFSNQAKVLQQGLGDKQYILGDQFTMADILVGHTLFWAKKFEVPIGIDNLEKYASRLAERDALKRTQQKCS